MSGWKVRLGDGSEIGPMDLSALRTWLAQGLVDRDSPVMRPGSRKWTPLGTVPELKGVVGARPKAAARPARARPGRPEPETPEAEEPTPVDLWRVRGVGALLLAAAAAFGYLAWRPADASPVFDGAPWLQVALGHPRARPGARCPAGTWAGASSASPSSSWPSPSFPSRAY